MNVLLLSGDQRAKLASVVEAFGWRLTGRTWASDNPALPSTDGTVPHVELIGTSCDHGWTVVRDPDVAFIDDTVATLQLARQLHTRVMSVVYEDDVGLERFALATPRGLVRELQLGDGQLEIDIGLPLFEHAGERGSHSFPEADILEIVDRQLGRSHTDVVLVEDVTILEIQRSPRRLEMK